MKIYVTPLRQDVIMNNQLTLIEVEPRPRYAEWELPPSIREIGLQGVLLARQALREARNKHINVVLHN